MADQSTMPVPSGQQDDHRTPACEMVQAGGEPIGRDIYFAAMQTSRIPMCLTDARLPDNPIVFCNLAFETLSGYSRDEIVGRNCRFLHGEDTDLSTVAAICSGLASGEDVHQEIYNYRKDGSGFWNALFISPVLDGEGRLAYHFASQLDVTQRRGAELTLRQSQRMEALGGLASGVAHELSDLMTIVLASLDLASEEDDAARRARRIERATRGARRASRLTDQMLSFARHQFHDCRVLDLNEMLANFDAILDQMAGPGTSVALRLAAGSLPAKIDVGRMEMALLNLVRNAADALPDGGEIVVATRLRPAGEAGGVPMVEVAVADLGTGMPAEVARRAAEPFFTTKERGKGTGFGLSMVNGFAEQSGGRMEIDTTPGLGTTIRLVFPMVAPG